MAEKKKKDQQPQKHVTQDKAKKRASIYLLAIAAAIIISVASISMYPVLFASVSFPTFKSNFQHAANVSVVIVYSNQTQSALEVSCSALMVESIAHSRKASTINYFMIDGSNATCTYQQSLGRVILLHANASYCLGLANAGPFVSLGYSPTNYTSITASRMYVYGNAAYFALCPIEIELS